MFKRILITCIIGLFLVTGIAVAQPVETVIEDPIVVEEPVIVEEPVVDEQIILDFDIPWDIIDKLPVLKQGIIYSIDDQDFKYASTTDLIEWKGITLEAGYAIPDTLLGVISYRLGSLQDLGINVPVLDLIDVNVGYYIGWKDVNNSEDSKFDHGLSFTLLNIKF